MQETVSENEPSEEYVDNNDTVYDYYDSYYDESGSAVSNNYDPIADNLVNMTPFDNESAQKYSEQVSNAYREVLDQIEYYERVNYQPEPSAEEKPFQSLPDLKWD